MAITGVKNFVAGAVLTASDVNQYLSRGVFVFASAAARTSAFSAAGITLSEGWVSYLQDVNHIDYYDGSAWVSVTAQTIQTVASASSIAVTSPGLVNLTGTTTVTTITGGQTGDILTVKASGQATGACVIIAHGTSSNNVSLRDLANFGLYANEALTLIYDGTKWVEIGRDTLKQLAVVTSTSNVTSTATTEAGATAILTLPAVTCDGTSPLVIDFSCFYCTMSTGGAIGNTALYDSATEVNKLTYRSQAYTTEMGVMFSLPITPSAASHTYSLRAWVSAGNYIFNGGASGGGSGIWPPMSMRISRAA